VSTRDVVSLCTLVYAIGFNTALIIGPWVEKLGRKAGVRDVWGPNGRPAFSVGASVRFPGVLARYTVDRIREAEPRYFVRGYSGVPAGWCYAWELEEGDGLVSALDDPRSKSGRTLRTAAR
jgi:hypothetical protein